MGKKKPKGFEDYLQLFDVILQEFSHLSFDSTGINNDESLNFRVPKKGLHFLSFLFYFSSFTSRIAGESLIWHGHSSYHSFRQVDGLGMTSAVDTAVWEGKLMQALALG